VYQDDKALPSFDISSSQFQTHGLQILPDPAICNSLAAYCASPFQRGRNLSI